MSQEPSAGPGRRSSRRGRRPDVTTLLAVVLPLLVAAALFLVRPGEHTPSSTPPTLTALTRSTVVCPSALGTGKPEVSLTSAGQDVDGPVRVGLGDDKADARVTTGQVTTAGTGSGPVAVVAEDASAPGLVAARFDAAAPAVSTCPAPQPDSWFTGVGAGAGHTSVLELTNPDSGTAIADVLVYGRNGMVDAPRLRGVSVPGGSSVEVDLAAELPRRDELTLEVVAARGRVGATVLDRVDPLGRGATTQDWLPAQSQPSTSNLLMGLAPGADGRRVLAVANGGPDEVRASIRIVTDRSVFTPKDVPDLRIPPQSTARISLSTALAELVGKGDATGLLVTATQPVTATLRSQVEGDLSHAVADPVVDGAATVLLPEVAGTTTTLHLAGAVKAGSVEVVARSAAGLELSTDTVDVAPDRGASLKLPSGAALLTVTPSRTTVVGAVLVAGDGAAVVPLTVPALNGLVPAVGPGPS